MTRLRRIGSSPGRVALALLGCEVVVALVLALAGATSRNRVREGPAVDATLAASLHLTDLALWSAATYCRHPSRADLFAAHSLHPAAPDYLPAGSIVTPPPALGSDRGWPDGKVVR